MGNQHDLKGPSSQSDTLMTGSQGRQGGATPVFLLVTVLCAWELYAVRTILLLLWPYPPLGGQHSYNRRCPMALKTVPIRH